MYLEYFGLKEAPFSIAVDPRFLFMSARHQDAMAHLQYGVGAGGGFILLTGEVGTGKTTVVRALLEQLPTTTDIAIILNPALNTVELLATLCDELNIEYTQGEQSLKVFSDKLHRFLLENYARGRKTVLLIDEAQHLKFEVLEQIRLLTNLETNTEKLLQIILVGQPELRTVLNRPELRQLAQRITARYQLKPLDIKETKNYIQHRLSVAGLPPSNQQLFPDSIIKKLHKISQGIPRLINVLCDRMLLGSYGKNITAVDQSTLKQAALEVMGEEEDTKSVNMLRSPVAIILSLTALFIVVGIIFFFLPKNKNSLALEKPVLRLNVPTAKSLFVEPLKENSASVLHNRSLHPGNSNNEDGVLNSKVPDRSPTNTMAEMTPWSANISDAFSDLSKALNTGLINCDSELVCVNMTASTWQELMKYNRPAVLTLANSSKLVRYAALAELSKTEAILYFQDRRWAVSLEVLGKQWTGEYSFIWQPPSFYQGPIALGDSGPLVSWLAVQFSKIDAQAKPLTSKIFNSALEQRVKIFQSNNKLAADGVVGMNTLLLLNEQLGLAHTLGSSATKSNHDVGR